MQRKIKNEKLRRMTFRCSFALIIHKKMILQTSLRYLKKLVMRFIIRFGKFILEKMAKLIVGMPQEFSCLTFLSCKDKSKA